jgi:hypothetical protein
MSQTNDAGMRTKQNKISMQETIKGRSISVPLKFVKVI